MKLLFLIQGEGRGHMTQAIALKKLLGQEGHIIETVLVGKSNRREIPAFFYREMGEVSTFQSPNFFTDKEGKGVKIPATISRNFLRFAIYRKSLRFIDRWVKATRPDVIVNFYDFLGAIYHFMYKPNAKFVAIGHQYLSFHPDFPFATGRLNRLLFMAANQITSYGAELKIALSFRPYTGQVAKGLVVTPPLVRQEVLDLKPYDGGYMLAYMVNTGYALDLMDWHSKHPDVVLHCFWDDKAHPQTWNPRPNLYFQPIDDRHFLQKLEGCSGYMTTAGFESVCEAAYLGKKIVMVPVKGHYEQQCNALDAAHLAGISSSATYNPDALLRMVNTAGGKDDAFAQWVHLGKPQFTALFAALHTKEDAEVNHSVDLMAALLTNNPTNLV
jgi:uncharacterized protein (TIGR00661 family)